ncbi:hypothetical protein J3P85_15810 [Pseudomonas sp. Z1-12]|uniref:hypothetical protein n=1 Tax=Pseudomonas sp. Z1-12 TaxID=2817408 RepID=UPI003DA8FB7A
MKHRLLVVLAFIAIAGCTSKTPLIFVSKTSVGVDVSAPGTGTGEFAASIGVNTLDAAYVPVVERIKTGAEQIHEVKSGESLTAPEREKLAALLVKQIDTETQNINTLQNANSGASDKKIQDAQEQIDHARQRVQALSVNLSNVLSRDDALSVFSAFDSNTLLRADSAGQGIGKVFATGLAAQNIARNFSQQAQAQASCKEKIAPTAATLAAQADQPSKDLAIKLLEACK